MAKNLPLGFDRRRHVYSDFQQKTYSFAQPKITEHWTKLRTLHTLTICKTAAFSHIGTRSWYNHKRKSFRLFFIFFLFPFFFFSGKSKLIKCFSRGFSQVIISFFLGVCVRWRPNFLTFATKRLTVLKGVVDMARWILTQSKRSYFFQEFTQTKWKNYDNEKSFGFSFKCCVNVFSWAFEVKRKSVKKKKKWLLTFKCRVRFYYVYIYILLSPGHNFFLFHDSNELKSHVNAFRFTLLCAYFIAIHDH